MRFLLAAALIFSCSFFGCAGSDPKQDGPQDTGREFVSTETTSCIDGNPAADPFDVGEADASAGTNPTLDSFQSQCRSAGGSDCDGAFISKEAARCVAQTEKMEPGLEPWIIGMAYERSYHRLCWEVENVLDNEGTSYAGKSLTLDAVSGRVLGRSDWATH